MKFQSLLAGVFAFLALSFLPPTPTFADSAQIVSACGTPNGTYSVGQTMPQTQTTGGLVCGSISGSVTVSGPVYGPTGVGSPIVNPPIMIGGSANGGSGGNVQIAEVDAANDLHVLVPDTANVIGTITSTQCVTLTPPNGGFGTFGYAVTGTWTGTLVPKVSVDGTNYTQTTVVPVNGAASTPISTLTANSIGQGSLSGFASVEICGATVGSGTATITLRANQGTAAIMQDNAPFADNITQWGSTTLGAPSNYGTSPGAVVVPGVNAFVTNTVAENIAQVNGSTVPTGAGATSSASQRVTVAQDTTTIAGAAPSTGIVVLPDPVTSTNGSTTITTGGTFQTLLASNPSRKGCFVQNPTTATEVLYISVGVATGSATVASSISLNPGGSFSCASGLIVVTDNIAVEAATTGHVFVELNQ